MWPTIFLIAMLTVPFTPLAIVLWSIAQEERAERLGPERPDRHGKRC